MTSGLAEADLESIVAERDINSREVKIRYRRRPSPPKPLKLDSLFKGTRK